VTDLKTKGQQNLVAKLEPLALVSLGVNWCADLDSHPSPRGFDSLHLHHLSFSPACSANCLQGLASGLLQRQSCLDSLSFWTHLLEESKAQIDVPQLPDRDGDGMPSRGSSVRRAASDSLKPSRSPSALTCGSPRKRCVESSIASWKAITVRGTARLCDVEKRTVLNILTLAGEELRTTAV